MSDQRIELSEAARRAARSALIAGTQTPDLMATASEAARQAAYDRANRAVTPTRVTIAAKHLEAALQVTAWQVESLDRAEASDPTNRLLANVNSHLRADLAELSSALKAALR